jgi:hypothetical protein
VHARPGNTAPTPLQLALSRGHRWLAMLESGEAKSMKEIARREEVAAILDETLPPEVTLFELAAGTPLLW